MTIGKIEICLSGYSPCMLECLKEKSEIKLCC